MNSNQLQELFERVQRGDLDVLSALARFENSYQDSSRPSSGHITSTNATAETSDAAIDLDRLQRCGFPEVVFAEGKTIESVVSIFDVLSRNEQNCLATRVTAEQSAALVDRFPNAISSEIARTVRVQVAAQELAGKVSVITAGTSDRPVAEEAAETLRWMNVDVGVIEDVGVAGPHRLAEQRGRFADADAIVVVAGMEGALPSVVGGHVDCPVIAVPTSVGYGANLCGFAALLGMLNSCASNVTVVNIDAGFKGGYVAGLIARRCAAAQSRHDSKDIHTQ